MADAGSWYHTLELPGGVVTPGIFDLRPYVPAYGLPERLDGMRALEVGTWDGFWAFELERRGATVVALDLDDEAALDWPARRRPATFAPVRRGAGFERARAALGSQAQREVCSVYDATPERLGTFDLVFCGSVLIHLRDQVLALERIAALTAPGGLFVSAEEYDPRLDLLPWPVSRYRADRDAAVVFWMPNRRGWRAMIHGAGFEVVREHGRFSMQATAGWAVRHAVFHARR